MPVSEREKVKDYHVTKNVLKQVNGEQEVEVSIGVLGVACATTSETMSAGTVVQAEVVEVRRTTEAHAEAGSNSDGGFAVVVANIDMEIEYGAYAATGSGIGGFEPDYGGCVGNDAVGYDADTGVDVDTTDTGLLAFEHDAPTCCCCTPPRARAHYGHYLTVAGREASGEA